MKLLMLPLGKETSNIHPFVQVKKFSFLRRVKMTHQLHKKTQITNMNGSEGCASIPILKLPELLLTVEGKRTDFSQSLFLLIGFIG